MDDDHRLAEERGSKATKARAGILLAVAAIWTAFVVAHYYAFPFARPEVADGLIGSSFPHWQEAAFRAFASLSGVGLTLLAAWGSGRLLMGLVSHGRCQDASDSVFENTTERLVFELATGFVVLSSLCLALALLHAYRAPGLYVLIALGVVAGVVALIRATPSLAACRLPPNTWRPDHLLPTGCLLAALAFAFIGALAPEIEYDALWYHLWLPSRWLEAGSPVDIVHEYVSLYPLFWELLSGMAMTIGGAGAAKLLHFACLPLLAAATWLLTRSLFHTANALLAAAIAVVSPTMIWEATTAYVDLALALFLTLSIRALVRFERTGNRHWLALGAITMGAALATKHLALVALAAMIVVLTIRHLFAGAAWRPPLRNAAVFLSLALAVAAPWYARAFVASGNPFFPQLYGVFGARPSERWSPATDEALKRFNARFGRERDVQTLLLLPWDVTVHGTRYGGTFGPVFLILAPLGLFGRRLPRTAVLVASGSAIYLAVWASPIGSFQLRFLTPLVPVGAAFAAAGIAHLRTAVERLPSRAAQTVLAPVTMLLLLNLPPFTRFHERDRVGWDGWLTHVMRLAPARVVFGAMSADDYLSASVPSYPAWSFIDRNLPQQSRILTFSGGDHFYSHRERLWSDATLASPLTWSAAAGDEADVLRAAARLGITHVLFDKRQIASGGLAGLAINSEKMRACHRALVWQDSRYELDRIDLNPELTAVLPELKLLGAERATGPAHRDLQTAGAAGGCS